MAPPISKEESGQQGGGWRKKSTRTVTVLYSYSYTQTHSSAAPLNGGQSDAAADDAATTTTTTTVSMREGERLVLLEKSNTDWWQVRFLLFVSSVFDFNSIKKRMQRCDDNSSINVNATAVDRFVVPVTRTGRFMPRLRTCTRTAV